MAKLTKLDFSLKELFSYIDNEINDELNVTLLNKEKKGLGQTNLTFSQNEEDGKDIIIILYEKVDGSKSLSPSGANQDLSRSIITKILSSIKTTSVKNGSKSIKGCNTDQVEKFIALIREKGHEVEELEDSDDKSRHKIHKVRLGEVRATFFKKTGTFLIQGASNLFFSEIVTNCISSFGHNFEEAFEIIASDATNASSVKWNNENLERTLRSSLGSKYDKLWQHDQQRLKTIQVFLDNELLLPDYSIFVAYVGFVVEGALKVCLVNIGKYNEAEVSRTSFTFVTRENNGPFTIDRSTNEVRLNFGLSQELDNYSSPLVQGYEFLRAYRHDFSHSRKNIQLIASSTDARDNIKSALSIIEQLL